MFEKSKLAQHAYENGHKICLKVASVLQIEANTTYRKCRESAPMTLIEHAISEPSWDISPSWTSFITAEVRKLQLRPV
jgi:hypothetical protein